MLWICAKARAKTETRIFVQTSAISLTAQVTIAMPTARPTSASHASAI